MPRLCVNAVISTLSLIFHVYWVKIIDNMVLNSALRKPTKLNISQLDLRNFKKNIRHIRMKLIL